VEGDVTSRIEREVEALIRQECRRVGAEVSFAHGGKHYRADILYRGVRVRMPIAGSPRCDVGSMLNVKRQDLRRLWASVDNGQPIKGGGGREPAVKPVVK
jgi:hypothetical protein